MCVCVCVSLSYPLNVAIAAGRNQASHAPSAEAVRGGCCTRSRHCPQPGVRCCKLDSPCEGDHALRFQVFCVLSSAPSSPLSLLYPPHSPPRFCPLPLFLPLCVPVSVCVLCICEHVCMFVVECVSVFLPVCPSVFLSVCLLSYSHVIFTLYNSLVGCCFWFLCGFVCGFALSLSRTLTLSHPHPFLAIAQRILEQESATQVRQMELSGSFPGTYTEITFWEERIKDLRNIEAQLSGEKVCWSCVCLLFCFMGVGGVSSSVFVCVFGSGVYWIFYFCVVVARGREVTGT